MNRLYQSDVRLFMNHFQPSMKLVERTPGGRMDQARSTEGAIREADRSSLHHGWTTGDDGSRARRPL